MGFLRGNLWVGPDLHCRFMGSYKWSYKKTIVTLLISRLITTHELPSALERRPQSKALAPDARSCRVILEEELPHVRCLLGLQGVLMGITRFTRGRVGVWDLSSWACTR